jgi:Flp pilus assembly protein TadD
MSQSLDAPRSMAVVFLALSLTLVASACSSDETPQPSRQNAGPTPVRTTGESPSTYGIDDVVTASMTMEDLFDVEPLDTPLGGEEAEMKEPGFLLPDLGLVAGDGANHQAEGETLYQQRRFLEAAAHFQIAVEEKPRAWYSSYMLGLSLWKAGDLDGAAGALQRSAEERPEFTRTHVNLSRVFNEAGRYGEALAAADRAAALEPDSAPAHYLRGRSLANMSRFGEAEDALRQSLDLNQENGDVWNRLGLMLLRQGRDEEAVAALERAVASGPATTYMHNNLGLAFERGGRLQEAEQQFTAALENVGGSPRAITSLARVRAVMGLHPVGEDEVKVPGPEEDRAGTEVATLNP